MAPQPLPPPVSTSSLVQTDSCTAALLPGLQAAVQQWGTHRSLPYSTRTPCHHLQATIAGPGLGSRRQCRAGRVLLATTVALLALWAGWERADDTCRARTTLSWKPRSKLELLQRSALLVILLRAALNHTTIDLQSG